MMLLNDWALLTGYRKRKIFYDLATSEGGRRVSRIIVKDWFVKRYRNIKAWYYRIRSRYQRKTWNWKQQQSRVAATTMS